MVFRKNVIQNKYLQKKCCLEQIRIKEMLLKTNAVQNMCCKNKYCIKQMLLEQFLFITNYVQNKDHTLFRGNIDQRESGLQQMFRTNLIQDKCCFEQILSLLQTSFYILHKLWHQNQCFLVQKYKQLATNSINVIRYNVLQRNCRCYDSLLTSLNVFFIAIFLLFIFVIFKNIFKNFTFIINRNR